MLFENTGGQYSSSGAASETFANEHALRSSTWLEYVEAVYGVSTIRRYPFSIRELAYFHARWLPSSAHNRMNVVRLSFPPCLALPFSLWRLSRRTPLPVRMADQVCTYDIPLVPRLCDPDEYGYGQFKPAAYPLHSGDLWRSWRASNRADDRTRIRVQYPHRTAHTCCYAKAHSECKLSAHQLIDLWLTCACVLTGEVVVSRGLPSHAVVEVTHTCCDDQSDGRSQGLWHYLQPGSGIFFNLGRTLVSDDNYFGNLRWQLGCGGDHFEVIGCLRGKGYDSVQLPHTFEPTDGEGGTKLYEVINLQDTHVQSDGCFDQEESAGKYFKGLDAATPCVCVREGRSWGSPLNCNGS